MEVTDENLTALAGYLQQTLNPDLTIRKQAESFLESVEGNQNYSLLLLQLMDKDNVEPHIRVSAAITFKNYVKRNWKVTEDLGDKVHEVDRATIKQLIVGLMLKSPEQVQKQLSDAISIIGKEDFPDKWPDLISQMVSKFESGDFHIINGILRTAHSLFKRYRHEFKSQQLWTEIKFVLDNFATPFTNLFNATMDLAKTHATNTEALRVIFSSIVLICKIFYSLNFQDIPEHFEDNMGTWMAHFLTLLDADHKILQTHDEEEAGLLEQVKSQICDNVALYAQKYDEEFSPHLPGFVKAIWLLLVSTGQFVKYDLLVSNAIQFLASVAERPSYKSLFEDSGTLASICEKVIVPNMQFRVADEELFDDNPEEYIRRDIEGSDIDTRRRSACDLVHTLCKSFEGPVIQNFSRYVQALLQEYSKDPVKNWKNKDAAIYLVTSLAAKAQTQKHGVTKSSNLVNVEEFYTNQILPHLQNPNIDEQPVLRADGLKYLMVFRNQLPKEVLVASFPMFIKSLQAKSPVVHTYAAHTIERILTVKNTTGGAAITVTDLQASAHELIVSLFGAMQHPGSAENEYIMKAIMRSLSMLQGQILPMVDELLKYLTHKLQDVSKNPSKPHFNHYLFESLCICIRSTCKANPESVGSFEEALFPSFTGILKLDVQEFLPYVFQVLSILIELHKGALSNTYMELFPFLLNPVLWERPGNIPPLVRLVQAYLRQGATLLEVEKLKGVLGVFQKLVASKTHDHEGFYLINTIIEFVPMNVVEPFLKQIFVVLFQRLQRSKTTKFIRNLRVFSLFGVFGWLEIFVMTLSELKGETHEAGVLVFFSLYAIKLGAVGLVQTIDGIQAKMFGMVIEKLYLTDLQKVSGPVEKKICAVGVTKILTEAPLVLQEYELFWIQLLQALIKLFELPEDESVPDDEHFIEIEDTPSYQTAYSQLAFAGKPVHDPVGAGINPKILLAKNLETLSASCPGKLKPMIATGLPEEAQTFLHQYLQAASANLA